MAGMIDLVANGGCYWPHRPDGRGHSLVLPNQTPFKVAVEGPYSNRFEEGFCRDGYYVLKSRKSYKSANETVNAVREPSTNAYEHMWFMIGSEWVQADRLRDNPLSDCDPVEERALKDAIDTIRHAVRVNKIEKDRVWVTRRAAKLVQEHPEYLENAKQALEARAVLDSLIDKIEF